MNMLVLLVLVFLSFVSVGRSEEPAVIIKAVWGADNIQKDVTSVLQTHMQNGHLTFPINGGTLGDLAFGKVKTITVYYRTASGDFRISLREGNVLKIPSPAAVSIQMVAQNIPNQNQPVSPTPPPSASSTTPTQDTAPPSPPPQHRLAPDGVYFLIERAKVTTDSGVVGIPPGTRVKRLSQLGDTLHVEATNEDDKIEFDIDRSQLTNDLDVAITASNQDTASRAAMDSWIAQQRQAENAQAQQDLQNLAARTDGADKRRALESQLLDLEKREAFLRQQGKLTYGVQQQLNNQMQSVRNQINALK